MEKLQARFWTVLTIAKKQFPDVYDILKDVKFRRWMTREQAIEFHAAVAQKFKSREDGAPFSGVYRYDLNEKERVDVRRSAGDVIDVGFYEWSETIRYSSGDQIMVTLSPFVITYSADCLKLIVMSHNGKYELVVDNNRITAKYEMII